MVDDAKLVFVVDDEEILRRIGATFLARLGVEVHTAHSGHAAIEMITQGIRPDLILTDLNMDDGDGFDLLRFVRQTEGYENVPVIVLSGTTEKLEIERAYRLGCTTFFGKPGRYPLILDEVAHLLGLRVRSAKRYVAAVSGWLHCDSRDVKVETGDISASGMFFETRCDLAVDDVYSANIEFSSPRGSDGHEFCFRVVRRVSSGGAQDRNTGYGVEFVFDNDDQRRDLERFLKNLFDD